MLDRICRILTEGGTTKRRRAINIMCSHFDSFTILEGTGFWKGKPESSLILEVCGDAVYLAPLIRAAALEIKLANHQESVLIQYCEVIYTLT